MVWFKVDDKAHSNTKVRKVLATAPAAFALWTVAGSWSGDNLTDGFVPDDQLPWLMPAGADDLARALVAVGLWRRVRGGYQFHQWERDGDGTRRNPTRSEVESERAKKAEAGRKGGLASGKTRSEGTTKKVIHRSSEKLEPSSAHRQGPPLHEFGHAASDLSSGNDRSTAEARASASATAGAGPVVEPPTRPDPTYRGGTSSSSTTDRAPAGSEPPSRCPEHQHLADPPPCGRCAGLRRARDETEAARRSRIATAPQCRRHRGQPADNCAPCRSEAIAPPTGAYPLVVRSPAA